MKALQKSWPVILLVLVATTLIWLAFGELFTNPNDFIFVPAGDGLRNYFFPSWYVKYGGGGRMDCMTYPWGDFALFADGHFLITQILNWINTFLFPVSDYTVGVLNFMMLFSLAFCPVFVYLILRRFGVAVWYAFLASLVIGFLSPQIQRYLSHYSLSYAMYVPMVWYFLIRMMHSRRKWNWFVAIVLSINLFGLLHPYYVPLGAFLLLSYAFVYTLQHVRRIKDKKHLRQNLMIYGAGFTALIVFMVIPALLDPVSDRHPAPYGIFHYMASFESVFLPSFGPVLDLWEYFTPVKLVNREGLAYVGVVGMLVLVFTTIRFLLRFNRRGFLKAFRFTSSPHMNGMLWAATLILILATAAPFIHMPVLLDVLPPLKQFRSLGRFAWMFFYVFTIYSAYYFYLVYKSLSGNGRRGIGISMVLVIFFFWGAEAFINTMHCSEKIHKSKIQNTILKDSNNDYSKYLKKAGYKPDDFQAMLVFPYFHNGSEKFYIYRSNQAAYEAYKALYDINIPVATVLSPRTSLSHSYQLAQLMSSDLIEKEMLSELNEKPFLILRTMEEMRPDEQALVDKAKWIYSNPYVGLYKLPVSAFESRLNEVRDTFEAIKDSIPVHGNINTYAPEELVYFDGFEEDPTPLHYGGKAALYGKKKTRLTFFEDTLSTSSTVDLEISIWIYSDNKTASYPVLFAELYNEQNMRVVNKNYNPKFHMEYSEGWVKATVTIPYKPGHRLVAYMAHENPRIKNFVVDNFLIRPSGKDVYHGFEEDGSFFYNNYKVNSN